MTLEPPIKPGQQFRDVQARLFGRVGSEWIVQSIFLGIDGLWHARIFLASDPSHTKTLSTSVLTDRRRFAPG